MDRNYYIPSNPASSPLLGGRGFSFFTLPLLAPSWSTDGVTRTVVDDLGNAWLIEASVPIVEGDKAKFLRLRVER